MSRYGKSEAAAAAAAAAAEEEEEEEEEVEVTNWKAKDVTNEPYSLDRTCSMSPCPRSLVE